MSGAHQHLSGLACRRRPRASRYQTSGSRPVRGDLVKSASTRRPAHPHTRGTRSFAEIPDVPAHRCPVPAGVNQYWTPGASGHSASGQWTFGRRVNQYLGVGRVGSINIWASGVGSIKYSASDVSGQSVFGRRVSGQSNIRRRTCRSISIWASGVGSVKYSGA